MRSTLCIAALLGPAILAPLPAFAQQADRCGEFKWPVARERAALTAANPPTVVAGGAYLSLGTAVAVALKPQAEVAYAVAPRRALKTSPAYGGELTFPAAQAETVQVTLSDDAWVDLVQNGKVLRSTAFSGKTGCPGVRKSIRFAVSPGPVTISISDSAAATLRLDVDTAP